MPPQPYPQTYPATSQYRRVMPRPVPVQNAPIGAPVPTGIAPVMARPSVLKSPPSDRPPGQTGPQPFLPPGPVGPTTSPRPQPVGTSPFVPPVGPQMPAPAPAPTTTAPPVPPVAQPPVYRPTGIDLDDPDGLNRLHDDYAPSADPRLTAARSRTDAAFTESDRYRKLGTAQDDALSTLTGGPDRTALAKQALADYDTEGEIGLQNRFRKVGQAAAKFGNIGLGAVNAELGSVQGDYERNRLQKRNELIRDVSEGDINDRFRRVSAVSGLRGQEADIGAQRVDQAGRLEDRIFGQGQSGRDELRGEREYQQGEAQRTIENRIRQRQLEDQAEQLRIRRALAQNSAGGQAPWDAAWAG